MNGKPTYEELIHRIRALEEESARNLVTQELLKDASYALGERVKELNFLYSLSNIIERDNISLEEIIQISVDLIPYAFQYPEITCAGIFIEDQGFTTENFLETPWSVVTDIIPGGKKSGIVKVCLLEDKPECDDGPFLKEEKFLLKAISERLGRIIEQKQVAEALRESEERYRNIFNTASVSLWEEDFSSVLTIIDELKSKGVNDFRRHFSKNPDFVRDTLKIIKVKDVNNATLTLFEVSTKEELLGSLEKITVPESLPVFEKVLIAIAEGKTYFESECINQTLRGKPVHVLLQFTFPSHREKMSHVLVSMMDITERKRFEEHILQAQKMKAIGTLAGGVAHDFNNLLTGIRGHASLMLLTMDATHPHHEKLKKIEELVQSAAELTSQLLGFAREGRYEIKSSDMNEIVSTSAIMFGRTRKEIKIHTNLQEGLWTVDVDQSQIDQVLMNMYLNAWEAMPRGGDLFLQTENAVIDETTARLHNIDPGRYIKISITDTGIGMDEATQQRLFEPFFTTKHMGHGAGLGLASAYGILKGHSGTITTKSTPGEGSTFTLYLPSKTGHAPGTVKVPDKRTRIRKKTVLLVDDEEAVLEVNKEILKTLDYNILTARNGQEAIKIYSKHKDDIDLVLLDMIMPEMGGGETFDILKTMDPQVRVILLSGYSINGEAKEILKRGCRDFIQKPFSLGQFAEKIRDILGTE